MVSAVLDLRPFVDSFVRDHRTVIRSVFLIPTCNLNTTNERMDVMRTYIPLSSHGEQKIRELMKRSVSVWEHRRLQCVLLRRYRMTAPDVAKIVGLHADSVKHIWALWKNGGTNALLGEKRGRARGAAHLTVEQERAFLQPFLDQATQGKLTTVRDVHAAHRTHMRKKINPTVTYRLLDRHGWRRVVPRPEHPKADKAAQEEFKVFFPQGHHTGENRGSPLWSPFPVDVQ